MRSDDQLQEAEEFFHARIPLTRAMGARMVAAPTGFAVEAPIALNHNHMHTAFGGSINAVATLAGYGFLWLQFRDSGVNIVIAESSIRFVRAIRGTIRAVCINPAAEELAAFANDLGGQVTARIRLRVEVTERDQLAAEFRGLFVARPPTAAEPAAGESLTD